MTQGDVFKTIIVGDNGTPEAERAVGIAISLAQCLKARVVLLGIVAPPSAESQAEGVGFHAPSEVRQQLEEKLGRTAVAGRQRGIEVIAEIADGEPEQEIERRAEQHSADLIVVGHREISRVRRWLEGSTSETLVRSSHISVLVVHDDHPIDP